MPVVSDQLGLCAGRTAIRPARASCSVERGIATDPAPEVSSFARALDLAGERDDGYDLMEQLARGEPPEITGHE